MDFSKNSLNLPLSNILAEGCLIIQKSGESGLRETLATVGLMIEKVPIPGRKRNYNLDTVGMNKQQKLFIISYLYGANMCMQLRF